MSHINPEILEFGRRHYGETCELVKRSEWSYSFKCGEKSYGSISRFMLEKSLVVNASEIRGRWPSMNELERLDFAANFHPDREWTDNDTEILEIIMQDGTDTIWMSCALVMLKHPGRIRVVDFLIDRVQKSESEGARINYMQALGLSGEARAASVIRPHYEKYLKAMEAEASIGVPEDVIFGPIPYSKFLSVAGDLFRITHSMEYEQAIRKYFEHSSEQVRWWAENALDVEGPTTLKRNA